MTKDRPELRVREQAHGRWDSRGEHHLERNRDLLLDFLRRATRESVMTLTCVSVTSGNAFNRQGPEGREAAGHEKGSGRGRRTAAC